MILNLNQVVDATAYKTRIVQWFQNVHEGMSLMKKGSFISETR